MNINRHIEVFNPDTYMHQIPETHVIGLGATGSRIALSLAKLGISNLHLWDGDKVEAHNISNQAFGQTDIDEYKSLAISIKIAIECQLKTSPRHTMFGLAWNINGIVFLLTDTMKSRKEIWESSIKMKPNVKLMIETRMGVDHGRIYTINPLLANEVKAWESTLCTDEEADVSACGTRITVGPTAEMISALAVWQLIRWFDYQQKGEEGEVKAPPENSILFSLNPPAIIADHY